MRGKILFISSVTLLFLTIPHPAYADASAQLKEAGTLVKNKQYQQAEVIYQQIVTAFPDTNEALDAQKQLTLIYITSDRQQEADAAFEKLLAGFSGHKDIAQAVHDIAYQYRCANKQQKANQIDQYVIDHWPDSDYAVLGQMDIAKYYVDKRDDPNAEAATTKLLTSYSGNVLIARAIHDVAQQYRGTRKYEKANRLYQYVINNWPDAEHALWSQADLIKSYVAEGNDVAADSSVDKLLANFNDNPLVARAVWDTAQYYRDLKKYEKANRLYKHVVENWPKAEHALWAQADLIKSYLALGDDTAANTAVDRLLTNFNDNPLTARAIWDMGQYYRDLKKYEMANKLYQHVVKTWTESEHALWAQADLIKLYLAQGNDTDANTAVDRLLTNFNDNPLIARAIHDTAWEYRKLGNYGRADELDKYVIDHWPADVQVMWAKMDMAKTDIGLGNYTAADKTIDILIADFNECPELPTAIFMLGEQYYNKAFQYENEGHDEQAKEHFRKAIAIWERIINELRTSAITPQTYYFAGCCYESVGEYEKAIEYYQVAVDTWPGYEYAWNAQFLIARCYEKLASSGQMPTADASVQICRACDKVITNYPDCMAVKAARNLLNRWNSVAKERPQ
jgi:tetratricopeptide (TPR) repeat protein